jgi:hypothetical protein
VDDDLMLKPEDVIAEARIGLRQNARSEVRVRIVGQDEWVLLFGYYADELTFFANEFAGLTVDQARQLFFDRDVAYLRSP